MTQVVVYDIAGVGIGPFNLGLAALAEPTGLRTIFFDQSPGFSWHPGIMLDFATLQVPFYADLVTGADPTSKYSYFSYLNATGRMHRFGILEDNYLRRSEYNSYCRWTARQLPGLLFRHMVTAVSYEEISGCYHITVDSPAGTAIFLARHLVLGTGSVPCRPDFVGKAATPGIFHSADYLSHREKVLAGGKVAIIGSGQSAAEIFYDLLLNGKWKIPTLDWLSRAPRLYPMDTSKFSLEMASPDYIDYFHSLEPGQQEKTLREQDMLYKGINQELLAAIYGELYHNYGDCPSVLIATNSNLTDISKTGNGFVLSMLQMEQDRRYTRYADHVILATGYTRPVPGFIEGISCRVRWRADSIYEVARNYSIDITGNQVFVQNAEIHTHGFNAPDLGMGPYRNAVILNTILSYERYKVEKGVPFQTFGVPE